MNTRILAFAGSKQAGKSTCSNFIHGYQLRAQEIIENFAITEQGRLIVKTEVINNKERSIADTYLDTSRKDEEFIEWAMYNMWPFVKKYSFADSLKDLAITLFGLTYDQVYGTEAHKMQQVPHLRWENMPGLENFNNPKKKGAMTVRDFLQYFGTEICRKIHQPIWTNRCIEDIKLEEPLIAIIDDCRFENEIKAVQAAGGKVIGLTRQPYEDSHASERVIEDNAELLDGIIDNQNMSIEEMCKEVMANIENWGWLAETTVTNNKKDKLHTIKG
jgi:hypothetical protein